MLKQILSVFIGLLGLFFLVAPVFAQSDEVLAKKYGITFPIAELGNCTSVASCKTFCDDPKNHQSCTDFAKKHKISRDSSKTSQKSDEEILKLARVELGCNSYDSCMQFCEEENNMEKCIDFAARHGLGDGNADQMRQVISSLKQQFGCSSMTSCMDTCNQPDNQQKCMEIFKQAGFDTGGGSYSNEPPEVWCPKISSECKWDGSQCVCEGPQTCSKSPGCSWNGQFCNCGGGSSVSESGQVWCPKIGPNCTWDGSQCVCPGTATQTSSPSYQQEPPEVWCPKAAQAGQICSWDGTSCTCWDPEGCKQASGCTWTGSKCECTAGSEPVNSASEPGEVWCPRNPDCTWNADSQICSCAAQTTSASPTDDPSVNQGGETIYKSQCLGAGCIWSDDPKSCDCSGVVKGVQEVSTNRGLLQRILDFILGR